MARTVNEPGYEISRWLELLNITREEISLNETTEAKVNAILRRWALQAGRMTIKKSDELLAEAMGLIFEEPVQRRMHLFNETFAKRLPASLNMKDDHGHIVETVLWPVQGEPRYIMMVYNDLGADLNAWCLNDISLQHKHINKPISKLTLHITGARLPPCWGPVPEASNKDWESFLHFMHKTELTPHKLSVHLPKGGDISTLLSVLKQHHSTLIIKRPLVEIFEGNIRASTLMKLQQEFNDGFSFLRRFHLLGILLIVGLLVTSLIFIACVFNIGNLTTLKCHFCIAASIVFACTIGAIIGTIGFSAILGAASFLGAIMVFVYSTAFVPYVGATIIYIILISRNGSYNCNGWNTEQISRMKKALSDGFFAANHSISPLSYIVFNRIDIATGNIRMRSNYLHLVNMIPFALGIFYFSSFGITAGMRGASGGVHLIWKEYVAFISGIFLGTYSSYKIERFGSFIESFHFVYSAVLLCCGVLIFKAADSFLSNGFINVASIMKDIGVHITIIALRHPINSALGLIDIHGSKPSYFSLLLDTIGIGGISGCACALAAIGSTGFALGDILSNLGKIETQTTGVVICLSVGIGAATGMAGFDGTADIIHVCIGTISVTFLIYQFPVKRSIAFLIRPKILDDSSSASEIEQWLQKMGDVYGPVWSNDGGRTSEESADYGTEHKSSYSNDEEQHESDGSACEMDEDEDLSMERGTHAEVNVLQTLNDRPEFIYSDFYRAPQTVFCDEPFVLEIQLRAGASTNIIWKHNGKILISNDHCKIQRTKSIIKLTIPITVPEDEGIYVAHAENDGGFFESTFRLLVFDKDSKVLPHKKTNPLPPDHYGVKVTSGDKAQLSHPKSSVVLTIPEGAVPEGMTLTISQQVLTDLGSFKHLLETDHQFITPVVKFHVDQEIEFCKPLIIEMRHCLNGGIDKIKAYHTSGSRVTCIPKSGGDLFFEATDRTVIITTQHLCKFYCASHGSDCNVIAAVLLFMSTEDIQHRTAVCLRPIFCAACAILPDFESNIKHIIDRNMEEIKRIDWPLQFKLTNVSKSRATLTVGKESVFTEGKTLLNMVYTLFSYLGRFLRYHKIVKERSFNNAFRHGMMPMISLADFTFSISKASHLAGSISISLSETSTDVAYTEDIEFIKDITMMKDSEDAKVDGQLWDYDKHELISNVEHLQELLDDKIPDVLEAIPSDAKFLSILNRHNVLDKEKRKKINLRGTPAEKGEALFDEIVTVGHLRGLLFALADTKKDSIIRNLGFIPEECKQGSATRAKATSKRKRGRTN